MENRRLWVDVMARSFTWWFKGKYIKVDVNEEEDREQNRTVFGSFDTSEAVCYFINALN